MKLGQLAQAYPDTKKLTAAINKQVTEANYMSGGDESWSLGEIIKAIDVPSQLAMCGLNGTKPNGKRTEDTLCDGMRYKLCVTTRQACSRDKDGNEINGWEVLPPDGTAMKEPIRPEWDDKPQEGDVIRVKGNSLTVDPDTGLEMNHKVRRNMAAQGKDLHRYTEYTVDKNLCITVRFAHAAQLLTINGVQIAAAKFKRLNKATKENDYKGQRKIYNWHFKEVPTSYRVKKEKENVS